MAKEKGLFLKKRRSHHSVFVNDMTFWGLKCCDLSIVLTHAHSGFYDIHHIVAEFLAFVLIGGAVLYQLVEGYGSTFVSCKLDEMYIESKNLVYQIGIEDGAVFAVVLNF